MSSALTFYFKEIFPTQNDFITFLNEFQVVDTTVAENLTFANYVYKILFRRYHNSNVQYDTPDDFKCDFANILEDNFAKYQRQISLIQSMQQLTEDEIITIGTALVNQANNPNTKPNDPTQPLEYISAQAFTLTKDNKLLAYLRAIQSVPTKLIDELLLRCVNLFKTILPKTVPVFVYDERS